MDLIPLAIGDLNFDLELSRNRQKEVLSVAIRERGTHVLCVRLLTPSEHVADQRAIGILVLVEAEGRWRGPNAVAEKQAGLLPFSEKDR